MGRSLGHLLIGHGGINVLGAVRQESLRRFCLKRSLSDKVVDSLLKSSGLEQNAPGPLGEVPFDIGTFDVDAICVHVGRSMEEVA